MHNKNNGRILLNVACLKKLRRARGLTQDDLAQECKISRLSISISSIKRAESGQKVLYRTALGLARYFNIDIEDIISDSGVRAEPTQGSKGLPEPYRPDNEVNHTSPHPAAGSRYSIALLIDTKPAVENELKSYLHHLNIPFTVVTPHIIVYISQELRDIDIFCYFKHLSRLLITQFQKRVRLCACLIYGPHSSIQNSVVVPDEHALSHPIIKTMRQILALTAWETVSTCPRIAPSLACVPLDSMNPPSVAADGWRTLSVFQPYTQFVGRKWELLQLNSCYRAVAQSREGMTVYIEGMEGIGKSALIHRFVEHIKGESNNVMLLDLGRLSVARQPALHHLTRQLLSLPAQASDAVARSRISVSTSCYTQQICMLFLAGVALNDTESRVLNTMKPEHKIAAIHDVLAVLIDIRTRNGQLMLIIEDMHLANTDFAEAIKQLAQLAQSKPLLLGLTGRKIGKYSHRPAWLEHACTIELTGLTQPQSMTIANTVTQNTPGDIHECIYRACGHPGYLLQMLRTEERTQDIKTAINIATAVQMNHLNTSDVMALKIAAAYEHPFSLEQWRGIALPLLRNPNAIQTPQKLVYAGLLKHQSDAYTFQHPAIRDAIKDSITPAELIQIEHAIQHWKTKRNLTSENLNSCYI